MSIFRLLLLYLASHLLVQDLHPYKVNRQFNLFIKPRKKQHPMDKIELSDFTQSIPQSMPMSVIMQKTPSDHPWVNWSYDVIGVVPSDSNTYADDAAQKIRLIHQENGIEKYLISGLTLSLHVDECESYYHNLMSPKPGCFIVANETDDKDEMPVPYLISLSFDEVHAYLEGEEDVYAVPLPQQLYQWVEAYILTHYVATKRVKRKLNNWKDQAKGKVRINSGLS